jgi:ketosteroid isomerase-like protein
MPEENIERVRAVYAEWAKGNFRAGGELWAPDIAYQPMVDGGEAMGRDAIERSMREFLAQWNEFRIEATDLVAVGETILVTERQRGTGKRSGIEIDQTSYAAWTFRDGLVVSVRWDIDRASALEGAGIQE